jgi:enoyl-[acyl-carrier protein] reductase I
MAQLTNKVGLIVGVANKRSISWAIAQAASAEGATLVLTYAGERLEENVRELAATLPNATVLPCDVTDDAQIDALFAAIEKDHGGLDFMLHGAAFALREDLAAPFVQTSREGFRIALDVSAYSLVALSRRAAPLMAALESSVRYLASDLGPQGIRVNAISAGPIKTLAAAGISGFSQILQTYRDRAPLRRTVETNEVADAAVFLLGPAGRAVTAEVLMVDGGFHAMGV